MAFGCFGARVPGERRAAAREGPRKKLGNPGFYLQLDKSKILIAGGQYSFPDDLLKSYRDVISDPKKGSQVKKILKKISKNTSYQLGGAHYKKVPRGYDKENPNAELLLHNGLYFYYEGSIPKEINSRDFLDYSYNIFMEIYPLHKWLRENVK